MLEKTGFMDVLDEISILRKFLNFDLSCLQNFLLPIPNLDLDQTIHDLL